MIALADELDQLQRAANNGRGISAARTLIAYLRVGDEASAHATAANEWDKLSSHEHLAQLLCDRWPDLRSSFTATDHSS